MNPATRCLIVGSCVRAHSPEAGILECATDNPLQWSTNETSHSVVQAAEHWSRGVLKSRIFIVYLQILYVAAACSRRLTLLAYENVPYTTWT